MSIHKSIGLFVILAVAATLCGCCEKGAGNQTADGKHRVITLYAADGRPIQTWEPDDGYDSFEQGWALFKVGGRKVKVTGCIVSEVK